MLRKQTDIWCNGCDKELIHLTLIDELSCDCATAKIKDLLVEEIPENWPTLDILEYVEPYE